MSKDYTTVLACFTEPKAALIPITDNKTCKVSGWPTKDLYNQAVSEFRAGGRFGVVGKNRYIIVDIDAKNTKLNTEIVDILVKYDPNYVVSTQSTGEGLHIYFIAASNEDFDKVDQYIHAKNIRQKLKSMNIDLQVGNFYVIGPDEIGTSASTTEELIAITQNERKEGVYTLHKHTEATLVGYDVLAKFLDELCSVSRANNSTCKTMRDYSNEDVNALIAESQYDYKELWQLSSKKQILDWCDTNFPTSKRRDETLFAVVGKLTSVMGASANPELVYTLLQPKISLFPNDKIGNPAPTNNTLENMISRNMEYQKNMSIAAKAEKQKLIEKQQARKRERELISKKNKLYSESDDLDNTINTLYPDKIRYNTFTDDLEIYYKNAWQSLDTKILADIKVDLVYMGHREFPLERLQTVFEAKKLSAEQYDPLKLYLLNLEWDGIPRVDTALHMYAGCENTDYTREVSRVFFLSMSARGLYPGSKVDTAVVFEGAQGTGKSTMLNVIGKDWYTGGLKTIGSEDNHYILRNVWLAEIAELASTRKSDIETVKNYMTQLEDRYRPKYGRFAITVPRRFVFAGTTNDQSYLTDTTGGRRFLPIQTGSINLEALKADIDQIHAEACHRVLCKERWFIHDKYLIDEAQNMQADRLVRDEYIETIVHEFITYNMEPTSIGVVRGKKLETKRNAFSINEIIDLYKLPATKNIQTGIGVALKELGYTRCRVLVDGSKISVYKR
jgi:predicted P-loop ATPase